jgi:hypothetical protein
MLRAIGNRRIPVSAAARDGFLAASVLLAPVAIFSEALHNWPATPTLWQLHFDWFGEAAIAQACLLAQRGTT